MEANNGEIRIDACWFNKLQFTYDPICGLITKIVGGLSIMKIISCGSPTTAAR